VSRLVVTGMWGLGDNIYSRPFVRAATAKYEVWLETPWPELYSDLNIKFVLGSRKLRTQLKNIARQLPERWSPALKGDRQIRIAYFDLSARSIIVSMERQWLYVGVKFDPALFDLPDMGPSPVVSERPIAVVRPVTVRQEWRNEARNPRPEYIAEIVATLMDTHHVVVVADLQAGHEWLIGNLPPAHQYFLNGELSICPLLALVRNADIVIGGVGWIVPAALALKVPTFIVLGGHGGHNAPAKITDPRLDLSRLGFAIPDRFCKCSTMLHNCDKRMADPLGQFSIWWTRLKVAA
jgi:hypothetical protein